MAEQRVVKREAGHRSAVVAKTAAPGGSIPLGAPGGLILPASIHALQGAFGNIAVQRVLAAQRVAVQRAGEADAAPKKQEPAVAELSDTQCAALIHQVDDSWSRVKATYIPQEAVMRRLLQYREKQTKHLLAEVTGELQATDNDANVSFFFAGSTDLTSDIDMTIISKHPTKGPAYEVQTVKTFNQRFRKQWGAESGTVFDVNLYARDFIPQRVGEIDKKRLDPLEAQLKDPQVPAEQKVQVKAQIKQIKQENSAKANEINAEAVGNESWQQTLVGEQKVLELNDVMALLKLRRFMSAGAWKQYEATTLRSARDPKVRLELRDRLFQADQLFTQLNTQLSEKIVELNAKLFTDVQDPMKRAEAISQKKADAEMEASNRLYEAALERVVELGMRIEAVKAEALASGVRTKAQAEQLDRLTNLYMREKTKALFFANESYHTGGALKDVVLNRQSGFGIELKLTDYLQSLNEQSGFIAEQLGHKTPKGQGFWKSAKYIDRLVMSVADMQRLSHVISVPSCTRAFAKLAKDLLAVKKLQAADAVKHAKAIEVAGAAGYADNGALLSEVLKVSAEANASARDAMAEAEAKSKDKGKGK